MTRRGVRETDTAIRARDPRAMRRRRPVVVGVVVVLLSSATASAGPRLNTGPLAWRDVPTMVGPWQHYNGDANTLFVPDGTVLIKGDHYQTRWCTPYWGSRIQSATVRRVRYNGAAALTMRIQDSAGQDLFDVPADAWAMADDVVYDHTVVLPTMGDCVYGGVYQRETQILNQGNLLLRNELRDVVLEDLQGPAVSQTSAVRWATGNTVRAVFSTADNGLMRGGTGAFVEGGGSHDLGDMGNGMVEVHVPLADLADGDNKRLCSYRDAPQWGRATQCTTFGVDRVPPTAPVITMSPDVGSGWTNKDVTVTFSGATNAGSGIVGYQRSENGLAWIGTPSEFTLTKNLATTFRARAIDALGRAGDVSTARTIRIDKTPPTAAIEVTGTPAPGVVSVSIGRTGDDLSGLQKFEIRLHTASGPVVATSRDELRNIGQRGTAAFDAGNARLVLVAYDKAGNIATARTADPVNLSAPQAAPALVLNGGTSRASVAPRRPFVTTKLRVLKQRTTRRVHGRIVPVVRRYHNGRVVLDGTLRQPDGMVIPRQGIELRDSAGRYIQGRRTNVRGAFRFVVKAGIGNGWTVNLVGQPQPRQVVAWMEVKPRLNVAMRMTSKKGVNRLVVTGRLVPHVGSYGKAVQLQWADEKSRWRPAINTRVGKNGRVRLVYQFRKPGGYAIKFRLAAPADRGWPYMAAISKVHRLRVR